MDADAVVDALMLQDLSEFGRSFARFVDFVLIV